jgi:hypothetical protein
MSPDSGQVDETDPNKSVLKVLAPQEGEKLRRLG